MLAHHNRPTATTGSPSDCCAVHGINAPALPLPCPCPALPCLQRLQDSIKRGHRVRLSLDGLPITTYDLQLHPKRGGLGGSFGGLRCRLRWRLQQPAHKLPAHAALCILLLGIALHVCRSTACWEQGPFASRPCMPAVRLGFEIGYELDGKFYINNHMMLLVLVRLLLGSGHMGRKVGFCLFFQGMAATTLQDPLLWGCPSSHQVVCTCAPAGEQSQPAGQAGQHGLCGDQH